jgi:hypothetical protein
MLVGAPPVVPYSGGSIQDVLELIVALNSMISSIMVETVTDEHVSEADFRIKWFLSCYARMDTRVYPNRKKPTWVTSYNIPCLLNLPRSMKAFGPLRNLWEGGVRGEGFLQYVKPKHGRHGMRTGWPLRMLLTLSQQKSLDMMSKFVHRQSEEKVDTLHRSTDCYKYPSRTVLQHDLTSGNPISVLFRTDGTFAAHVAPRFFAQLSFSDETSVSKAGFQYIEWELTNDDVTFDSDSIALSCILLPWQSENGKLLYACITDTWQCWDGSSQFEFPS